MFMKKSHSKLSSPSSIETIPAMNLVVVGHVDHGKSTLIGKILSDTGSLSSGKLEQVKAFCAANSRPFEYAFLLDALKDEQSQGITIDSARCFFKTKKRKYIIIDAPGHIEFLKNMITGAARAEAAVLVIDAHEGVQENSKRHGFMLSMLKIDQVVVVINKMDLVNYDQKAFNAIVSEYSKYLEKIGIKPIAYVPASAIKGENLIKSSPEMTWYKRSCLLDLIDSFEKEKSKEEQPFRFPVQDIYKFTQENDYRRILAGTVATGTIKIGEEVVFMPSRKHSKIKTIESFNCLPKNQIVAGSATGFTFDPQIYIQPGEVMCKMSEKENWIQRGTTFKANLFWLGKNPMVKRRTYKLKIATMRSDVFLNEVINIVNSSDLSKEINRNKIYRHDVAECILETTNPISFDLAQNIAHTGRFVIVDDYEISGGGIITENVQQDSRSAFLSKEFANQQKYRWNRSLIKQHDRQKILGHKQKLIIVTGEDNEKNLAVAHCLEKSLFKKSMQTYFLGFSSSSHDDINIRDNIKDRSNHINQIARIAHHCMAAGLVVISLIPELEQEELEEIKRLNENNNIFVVKVEENLCSVGDKSQKFKLYASAITIANAILKCLDM
jgi:bifunctional enzyme CysN/CysC